MGQSVSYTHLDVYKRQPQKGRDGYDGGIYQRMHWHTWTDQDIIINGAWQELFKAVGFCNQVLNDLNNSRSDILPENKKKLYIAESRALRAFFYSMLVDMFGNVPIVEKVSELNPPTKTRTEVFNYVEKEIAEVKDQLLRSTDTGSYGRFTQEAALALLSRLYPVSYTHLDVYKRQLYWLPIKILPDIRNWWSVLLDLQPTFPCCLLNSDNW